jgi:dihydrofolate synthase/folylpolyglutamate synthase
MEHLGADLPAIAGEKGGIIKNGVPVVLGRQVPEARQILAAIACERQSPLFACGGEFFSVPCDNEEFSFHGLGLRLDRLRPGLPGRHQHDNLSLAIAAAVLLRRQGVDLPEHALRQGVEKVFWPGRLEWWGKERRILLDGAHNEGGAQVLADYLSSLPNIGVRWVVGMKRDKQIADIFGPLLPHCTHLYCTAPPIGDCMPPAELARAASDGDRPAAIFPDPPEALTAALKDRRQGEIVLVAGSLFLVAAAREFLLKEKVPA